MDEQAGGGFIQDINLPITFFPVGQLSADCLLAGTLLAAAYRQIHFGCTWAQQLEDIHQEK